MGSSSGAGAGAGTGSPCGACKFLRRKCASDCIFAPYFSQEHDAARFAAIHKVFGASNASKLLLLVPQRDRCEAVVTIAYEAQARLRDPVYGCVAHIYSLQQQVATLQAQVMQAKAQLARGRMENIQCQANVYCPQLTQHSYNVYGTHSSVSPQSSLDCVDNSSSDGRSMPEASHFDHDLSSAQIWSKRSAVHDELSELQALASRMMRN